MGWRVPWMVEPGGGGLCDGEEMRGDGEGNPGGDGWDEMKTKRWRRKCKEKALANQDGKIKES